MYTYTYFRKYTYTVYSMKVHLMITIVLPEVKNTRTLQRSCTFVRRYIHYYNVVLSYEGIIPLSRNCREGLYILPLLSSSFITQPICCVLRVTHSIAGFRPVLRSARTSYTCFEGTLAAGCGITSGRSCSLKFRLQTIESTCRFKRDRRADTTGTGFS